MKAQKTCKRSVEWSNYRKARNRCTNLLRTAESNYWQSRFNEAKSREKFWQDVKLMQGKCKAARIGPIQGKNGEIISDDKTKANSFNEYFSNIGKNLSQVIIPPNPAPEITKGCTNALQQKQSHLYEKGYLCTASSLVLVQASKWRIIVCFLKVL